MTDGSRIDSIGKSESRCYTMIRGVTLIFLLHWDVGPAGTTRIIAILASGSGTKLVWDCMKYSHHALD